MKRIAIFASGSGSNAEAILSYAKTTQAYEVALVICNRREAIVMKRAEKWGVRPLFISNRVMDDSPQVIMDVLKEAGAELIVLAGFLKKVPEAVVNAYDRRMLNIHPSLLPRYGGKGMYGLHVHRAVLDGSESESGMTVHLVTNEFDKGQVIAQARCAVLMEDTAESLAQRVLRLEHAFLPEVIDYYCQGLK